MRFIRVAITFVIAFAIMMMPFLMAPEIEEFTTQYQKSKDSLRVEYEKLVDETVVESMIITGHTQKVPSVPIVPTSSHCTKMAEN